jgi:hypothetical protein
MKANCLKDYGVEIFQATPILYHHFYFTTAKLNFYEQGYLLSNFLCSTQASLFLVDGNDDYATFL